MPIMKIFEVAIEMLLYLATIYAGYRIYKWKYRLSAIVLPVIFPFVGIVLALFIDARCRHCDMKISMAASVCPHCGRNVKDGKVTVK